MALTASDLRSKSDSEFEKKKAELKEELFRLKVKKATSQLEKIHRVKEVKRDLARLLTVENEKKNKK